MMKKRLPILFSLFVLLACILGACGAPQTSNTSKHVSPIPSPVAMHSGGRIVLTNCTIQTLAGYYLTAVGGGGRITDVIHTDATRASSWEKFNFLEDGVYYVDNHYSFGYSIQTIVHHTYLTAVGGGGRITDVIHSDATVASTWEFFLLENVGKNTYDLRTYSGNFLTAVNKGGLITNTIHSDATSIGSWEEFYVHCDQPVPTFQ